MKKKNFRNAGTSRSERLQNIFTKYLTVALMRNRNRYIKKKLEYHDHHVLMEPGYEDENVRPERDDQSLLEDIMPCTWSKTLDQITDETLFRLLSELTQDEAMVLYRHTILDLSYKSLAITELSPQRTHIKERLTTP